MKIKFLLLVVLLIPFIGGAYVVYNNFTDYTLQYGNTFNSNMDGYDQNDITIYGDGLTNLQPFVMSNYGKIATKPGLPAAVRAFNSGVLINSGYNWTADGTNKYINHSTAPGEFPTGQDKYLAVQINKFGALHYGWVLVQYTGPTLIIKSYAYESVAGVGITTGATSGGPGAGVEEIQMDVLSIYPNPAVDLLHIERIDDLFDATNIQLLDHSGKILDVTVNEISTSSFGIDLTDIPSGNYFLYIHISNAILMEELVIVKD